MKERDRPLSREDRLAVELPMPKNFSNRLASQDAGLIATLNPTSVTTAEISADTDAGGASVSRNLVHIPVELIDPNPLAPREVYTPEMISARAEDLRDQGQHDPIHVIRNPEYPGRYIICDGWTRVQACTTHKVLPALLAQVHELSLQESAWFGYEQNEGRAQHTDFDRAMFYEKMIAQGETAAELARRAKLPRAMMTFYRAYKKLPDEILDLVRERPLKFSARVAYSLHQLHEAAGIRRTLTVATKFAEEDQTVRWLSNQVQAATHPKQHKVVPTTKHIKYSNGYYKQREDAFELSIEVEADKREAFAQALEALLETVAVKAAPTDQKTAIAAHESPTSASTAADIKVS